MSKCYFQGALLPACTLMACYRRPFALGKNIARHVQVQVYIYFIVVSAIACLHTATLFEWIYGDRHIILLRVLNIYIQNSWVSHQRFLC